MAVQLSTTVRNARLDAVETAIGTGPILRVRTGAPPADCAAADSGSVLVSISLPSDWASAASGGSKAFVVPQSGTASGTGTAAHFRIYDSGGSTCHMQGTVATSGADLTIDNASVTSGQTVTLSSLTLTDANS